MRTFRVPVFCPWPKLSLGKKEGKKQSLLYCKNKSHWDAFYAGYSFAPLFNLFGQPNSNSSNVLNFYWRFELSRFDCRCKKLPYLTKTSHLIEWKSMDVTVYQQNTKTQRWQSSAWLSTMWEIMETAFSKRSPLLSTSWTDFVKTTVEDVSVQYTAEPVDLTKWQGVQGIGEIGLLYRGFVISRFFSIPYISLGWKISFVIPRTLLYRGSLNRGSTVLFQRKIIYLMCLKFIVMDLLLNGE